MTQFSKLSFEERLETARGLRKLHDHLHSAVKKIDELSGEVAEKIGDEAAAAQYSDITSRLRELQKEFWSYSGAVRGCLLDGMHNEERMYEIVDASMPAGTKSDNIHAIVDHHTTPKRLPTMNHEVLARVATAVGALKASRAGAEPDQAMSDAVKLISNCFEVPTPQAREEYVLPLEAMVAKANPQGTSHAPSSGRDGLQFSHKGAVSRSVGKDTPPSR